MSILRPPPARHVLGGGATRSPRRDRGSPLVVARPLCDYEDDPERPFEELYERALSFTDEGEDPAWWQGLG